MNEENEKKIAEKLGGLIDGALRLDADDDPELLEAAGTAAFLSGALDGDTATLNPDFSESLRARLVRETGKRSPRKKFALPKSWIRLAVAAVIFIFIVPAGLWTLKQNQDKRLALVEKYDKMYVPYTLTLKEGSRVVGSNLVPLSEKRTRAANDISRKWREEQSKMFFKKSRWERSSGK